MRLGLIASTTLVCLALSACDAAGPEPAAAPSLDAEALARGRALFLDRCAICHGERGDGRGPRHASLARRPANFRSPLWRASADPERVRRAIRNGVPGTDMPPWIRLGEQAVEDLTAYVLGLGPL
jgi:mono/diheme cytochrome c family protein